MKRVLLLGLIALLPCSLVYADTDREPMGNRCQHFAFCRPDLTSPQIRHQLTVIGWQLWLEWTKAPTPAFYQWPSAVTSSTGFLTIPQRNSSSAQHSSGAPLITFTHYSQEAFESIVPRVNGSAELQSLSNDELPQLFLPANSQVALTAWWPVAADSITPIPVWDSDAPNRRESGSNGYLHWPTVYGVVPPAMNTPALGSTAEALSFAGRRVNNAPQQSLRDFHYLTLDAAQAQSLMTSHRFKMASQIALGRTLRAGDHLALVAAHLLTNDTRQGIWSTYWWQPLSRPPRHAPNELPPPWRHYHMDITVDANVPKERDGSPNICFNPWFDGVFADSGQGNGLQANCVSCHLKAATPLQQPLHVTRGIPALRRDADTLYTGLLWSVANPQNRSLYQSDSGRE